MFYRAAACLFAVALMGGAACAQQAGAPVAAQEAAQSSSYQIMHLEPPSWWVGFKAPKLQIMVHGPNIADLTPMLEYPGVKITKVSRTSNPNYLFLDLILAPSAAPGSLDIRFVKDGRAVMHVPYALQARAKGSAQRKGFGPADAIYLVTPDRFANGDPGNDTVRGLREAADRSKPGGRHGGDLQGVINHLDYIAGMGFTQLWLNPVLENDQPDYSYHGYAATNFYKVDPRYGGNADTVRLSREAGKKGIGLIMDMVTNHIGDQHWWVKDLPEKDWFNFSGAPFTQTNHIHLTVQDPHASQWDRKYFADGWFVPSFPDLNQRNPYLGAYLVQNAIWWVEYAGLSGIRVDTYPYNDKAFMSAWSKRLHEEYPSLTIVGEEWVLNPAMVAYWQLGKKNQDDYLSYLPSMMDFPLQDAVRKALIEPENFKDGSGLIKLYEAIGNDFIYADPGKLVVFPDNHDIDRIYTQLGEDLSLAKLAVALVATTRGIPQIYYGTEVLLKNPGTHDDGVRRSDFPGGWAGDKANGFTGAGLDQRQQDFQAFVKKLFQWRKTSSAIHTGKLVHFAPYPYSSFSADLGPQDGVYVYFRYNEKDRVMVALNHADKPRTLGLERFKEMLAGHVSGVDVISGRKVDLSATLHIEPRSALIVDLK